MAQENRINRDLFFKVCFIYFANYILRILGIDEEIVEITPTELIGFENLKKPKIFNNFLDFAAVTKSGKIILFEFKKNPLRTKDLKQAYRYFDHVHCKNKAHVDFIVITISKKGNISTYEDSPLKFKPLIIKTKMIDKQKDLSTLRDKLKHNTELDSYGCSLMITIPLFKIEESEAEIIEEMCKCIEKKNKCIPAEELDGMVLAMYFNIIEYIDEDRQEDLMEMIGLSEKIEGIIAGIKKDGEKEGRKEERKDIIDSLIDNFSSDDGSEIVVSKSTLLSMLQK